MKLRVATTFALLLDFATCRVVPAFPGFYTVTNVTTLIKIFGTPLAIDKVTVPGAGPVPSPLPVLDTPAVAAEPTPLPSPIPESEWDKYVCHGEKLNEACKSNKYKAAEFIKPIDTPWDGTLEAELALWGYNELPADSHCSFDDIAPALKALKIGLLSRAEGGANCCYQVRHWDDEARNAQGEKIDQRDQTYKVDGKEYRMTGAYSIIGANPRSGVIFFVDVRSAVHAAEELWSPKVPTADTLPALRSISDLAWGFWNRVAKGKRFGKINYFVVHNIVNKATNQLIEQSLSLYNVPQGQQRVTQLPKWPGLTFGAETDAGQAMLGPPNGIAAAYFLSQHKTQLGGNKYIYQVSVFTSEYDRSQPSMIFHVKDVSVSASNNGKALARRDSALANNTSILPILNTGPAFGGDSPPPTKRPKSNPPSDPSSPTSPAASPQSAWAAYVCRGEKLTRASKLNRDKAEEFALPIDTPWDGTLEAERKLWGYTLMPHADCDFEGEYYDITRAYRALNVLPGSENESDPEDSNDCFRVFHYDPEKTDEQGHDIELKDQTYKVNDKVYRATGAHGTFGINVEQGIVWFIDVASASLKAASLWGVDETPVDQLPALRQMSDLAWGFWHEAHDGSDLGHITKFIVPQIINEETLNVIQHALETYTVPDGQERLTAVPTWPGVTFDIETEQGKALLGSPNGIAAAYFLSQHKQQMGANKYVHKIAVFQPDDDNESGSEEPTIVYYVKDAPIPSSEDQNTEEEPAEKTALARRDDQAFWTKYVCRGEKLTQASLRNKDTAIQYANPIDSEWDGTLEEELKLWGYTDYKGQSLYCELNNIAESLNTIGVDAKFKPRVKTGQNQCFNIGHGRQSEAKPIKDQTYEVDGKTYRMTDAYSHMGVNARDGVLTFLAVRSAERGAQVTWKVHGPAADELPKLRQISDLAWAFWKREHKDGAGLDNINKFLVHDIVNSDTEKLIKQALLSYQVPKGGERYRFVPKWPGLVFSIDSDEGKAMLGSPNGMAAGYFLAQHKTQLGGNKYVYQTTVWNDRDGDLQMMFWVKNAPSPPEEDDGDKTPIPQHGDVNTYGKVSKRSADGRNIIREHVVRARL